jgi:hypothetical protein
MALTALTGQNIQDTYQKVVQTDGTNLADGTGSLLPISIDGNDVIISGSLTANEYIVSSSVTNITIATLSGSTDFGDDTGDTHKFTGSLFISGTYVGINNDNPNYTLDVGGSIHSTQTIHCSGLYSSFGTFTSNINANGNIVGDNGTNISGINTFNCIGNATLGNATTDAHTINGTLSATNNVTSTTMVQAPTGSFKKLKGDTTLATGLFINGTITASGDISSSAGMFANIGTFGEVFGPLQTAAQPNITSVGTLTGLNLGGNLNLANNSKIISTNESTTYIKLNNDDYWIINANGIDTARFSSLGTVFNEGAAATANFRVESGNDQYALYIDGGDDTIELGRAATTHVTASGNISASGTIYAKDYFDDGVNINTLYDLTPTGTISSSAQLPSGILSSSAQLPSGTISSSAQLPSGILSSSAQLPSGIISSSLQNLGNITGSNISASGRFIGDTITLGDVAVATTSFDFHIRNSTAATVAIESWGNNNAQLQFLSNQNNASGEPDFAIGQYHTDGGFQVRSELKQFLIIGADNGDEIKASGSLNVTSDITSSGNISSSGNITVESANIEGHLVGKGTGTADSNISGFGSLTIFNNATLGNSGDEDHLIKGQTIFEGQAGNLVLSRLPVSASSFIAQTHITASGNISASGDLIASSSLTLSAPLSKIIGPGGNDFMALGVDNIDIFIDGGEVINVDNNSINLNVSNANIDTSITSDDGTLLFFGDASNNTVRLNNSIIMSPGAPTDYTNRLLISGSTHFTGSNSHITASGNISASKNVYAKDYFDDGVNINTLYDLTPTGTISGSSQLPSGIISGAAQLPSGTVSGSAQIADVTLTTAAQGNITSVGILTSLTASGNISSSLASTGSFGRVEATNVHASGYIIAKTPVIVLNTTDNSTDMYIDYSDTVPVAQGGTQIPWDKQEIIDTDFFTHSTSTNNERIYVTYAGRYEIMFSLTYNKDSARACPVVRPYTNGSWGDFRFQTNPMYQRASGGQNNASLNGSYIMELDAGDYFSLASGHVTNFGNTPSGGGMPLTQYNATHGYSKLMIKMIG